MLGFIEKVRCPARYAGGEWNAVKKDPDSVKVKFAMCFPDAYEVGMSHLGSKILYHEVNRRDDALAERVFCPWPDMQAAMQERNIALASLENRLVLSDFDILGFTLQYELTFTNILNMMHMGRVPLYARDRGSEDPLVIGGGPCAYNPEPIADFFDAFVIGEGEEVIHEVLDTHIRTGRKTARESLLLELSRIPGVYVPAFYDVTYNDDGTIKEVRPNRSGVPTSVTKRVIKDLDNLDYPSAPVVPYSDVVHDRAVIEVFRGCTRGCRFCQAGSVYRPVRERSASKVAEAAATMLKNTGYDEVSLTSLSSNDYSKISEVIDELLLKHSADRVGVSLPSLRVDAFSVGLAEKVHKVRRTTLTFAPEAGTQRLRDVINKNVTEEDITAAAEAAFSRGWDALKLYFMIGLPTETEEDVLGIAETARELSRLSRRVRGGRGARLTLSVATFVPKAHTPFQWHAQDSIELILHKQEMLRAALRKERIRLDWHDSQASRLEAVFARGDRRLSEIVYLAWKNGAGFDGWTDRFDHDIWARAFAETGIDPGFYANRERRLEEVLPWDHVSAGLDKAWLVGEFTRAKAALTTPDCRWDRCTECGVCPATGSAVLLKGDDLE